MHNANTELSSRMPSRQARTDYRRVLLEPQVTKIGSHQSYDASKDILYVM